MKIVCVCTGNTCRSPMAAALLQRLLPAAEISSAGLYAEEGAPASRHALLAMDEMGLDISQHRARRFRPEMADGALLLAMTRSHARALRAMCPEARVERFLGDEDVPDPFGQGMEAYERTAEILAEGAQALARRLRR
ncbi:MAG TPA: low molecular weight protein arginine phosphatase [Candidatus Pullichristensenella avicola]|nr:low molecular weight protein arginine phosphatase [Candidatus Pullichristensenella avicola]